jgi:hypothetical protein
MSRISHSSLLRSDLSQDVPAFVGISDVFMSAPHVWTFVILYVTTGNDWFGHVATKARDDILGLLHFYLYEIKFRACD